MQVITEYKEIEVLGAEKLFNLAYEEQYDMAINEGFFVSCGTLNSESDCNGYPIEIEGLNKLSHLRILTNGLVIAICYNEEDDKVCFRVDSSGFIEIEL
tara:strand:- start:1577 stop:1873 length:297 start_codon:yes stop_codon:yes gene_type:complete